MFKKYLLRNTLIALILGISITLTACSKSSSSSKSYSGPGSVWNTTLNSNGTFQITKAPNSSSAIDLTVNGNYSTLSTGFLKLTVTSATGTDAPAAGDAAYALDVPGYVFVLKPIGSGDQIIPMVVSGGCPTTDIDANWVKVNLDDTADLVADAATMDIAGTFNYAVATSAPSLPTRYDISGGSLGAGTIPGSGSCSDGVMTIGTVEMFLTSNGGAIVNTNTSDPTQSEFIFGFGQKAISDNNSLDGEYSGLLFNGSAVAGSQIQPVSLSCSAGVCTGTGYDNVETGSTTPGSVSITLNTPDVPSTGFITGTITDGTSGNIVCMFDINAVNSGKTIGSCAGQDPGDNTKLFNVLLVSK